MLLALQQNKLHRSMLQGAEEDALTSAVIRRLWYLGDELFLKILLGALTEKADFPTSSIQSVEFWPRWNAEDTTNQHYVEPDVFIQCADYDIIIEAKRWDDKQQSRTQWENELRGYLNEYGDEDKRLLFIALGGIHHSATEEVELDKDSPIFRIYKAYWKQLLKQVKEQLAFSKELTYTERKILQDIVGCFALFKFYTAEEFTNFSKAYPLEAASFRKMTAWRK